MHPSPGPRGVDLDSGERPATKEVTMPLLLIPLGILLAVGLYFLWKTVGEASKEKTDHGEGPPGHRM